MRIKYNKLDRTIENTSRLEMERVVRQGVIILFEDLGRKGGQSSKWKNSTYEDFKAGKSVA